MLRSALRRGIDRAALIGGFVLAAPAAARASVEPAAATVYTMSPGRIGALLAIAVGLIGAIIGGRAFARSAGRAGTGKEQRSTLVALVLGAIALLVGGLVVASADGGLGTGHGLGGGVAAMMVGLVGMTLGGMARARFRRHG
jgi:uncharacterized membrane protein YeaQ/YmgE (transglycosylase-associated protein family)